jgi:DNA polymerase-3 subunit epsilon
MTQSFSPDTLLRNLPFVAFDTETTGLDAAFHRVVEIGAVQFRPDSETVTTFATLVDPGRPMPPEVIPIHGITDEMVAGAPLAEEALRRFYDFCPPNAILLAHNAPFDLSFLGCESDKTGIEAIGNPVLDTVEIARQAFVGMPSYSLETLARLLKVAPSQEHRALADAVLVRGLFLECMGRFGQILTYGQLTEKFRVYRIEEFSPRATSIPEPMAALGVAVEQKLRVEIVYASMGGSVERRVIRPYLVHTRQAMLYVSAFCEKANADRTFRLDRIREIRLLTDL